MRLVDEGLRFGGCYELVWIVFECVVVCQLRGVVLFRRWFVDMVFDLCHKQWKCSVIYVGNIRLMIVSNLVIGRE